MHTKHPHICAHGLTDTHTKFKYTYTQYFHVSMRMCTPTLVSNMQYPLMGPYNTHTHTHSELRMTQNRLWEVPTTAGAGLEHWTRSQGSSVLAPVRPLVPRVSLVETLLSLSFLI